ncbi:hypothetical protein PMI07_001124 [Rhizobium sp. CF080]|nr:hypothetical protein PMI07_001124 [Rhizobium sp. CF080]
MGLETGFLNAPANGIRASKECSKDGVRAAVHARAAVSSDAAAVMVSACFECSPTAEATVRGQTPVNRNVHIQEGY